jgi:hypothetical protein
MKYLKTFEGSTTSERNIKYYNIIEDCLTDFTDDHSARISCDDGILVNGNFLTKELLPEIIKMGKEKNIDMKIEDCIRVTILPIGSANRLSNRLNNNMGYYEPGNYGQTTLDTFEYNENSYYLLDMACQRVEKLTDGELKQSDKGNLLRPERYKTHELYQLSVYFTISK